VKLKASEYREQHLEDRLSAAQLQGDDTKTKAIAIIQKVEALQAMYRKIRTITKNKSTRHFSHLIVPHNNQETVITTPTDIFQHLITRNADHFSQAQGTMFSLPPLNRCTSLPQLFQHLDNPHISEASRAIIRQLHDSPSLPKIETYISTDSLKELYRVWNESTATSPSGIHLGHDKCILPGSDTDDIHSLAKRVYDDIKMQMINIALRYGIIYPRWLQINTIMIEKCREFII